MKRKALFVTIALILVISLIGAACASKEAPAPPPTPAPAPPSATAPAPPPAPPPVFTERTLHYANTSGAGNQQWIATMEPFSQELSRLTDGAITVVPHHGGSLLTGDDALPGLQGGLADLAHFNMSNFLAEFPSSEMGGLNDPYISGKHDTPTWAYINFIVIDKYWQAEAERAGVHLLFPYGNNERSLFTNKKIEHLSDIQGLKLRGTAAGIEGRFLEALGAVAIPVSYSDYLDAVTKGVVDGCFSVWAEFHRAGKLDPTPYILTSAPGSTQFSASLFSGAYANLMSGSLWDSLSNAEKEAVLQAVKYAEQFSATNWYELELQPEYDAMKASGKYTFTPLPTEELEQLMSDPLISTQWQDAAKLVDDTGGPGTEQLNEFLRLADMSKQEVMAEWEKMWADRLLNLW